MKRYAFSDIYGTVVQIIDGHLDLQQQQQFLNDYRVLFGATMIVTVDEDIAVWIGGSYDANSGTFSPPPSPEIQPIIEEIANDHAPIE
jgi:hypothetical protein